jgi:hypothetical protein
MADDLSILFIDAADAKVRRQIEKATALETPFLREKIDKAVRDQREIEVRVAFHANRRNQEAAMHFQAQPDAPQEFLALRSASMPEPAAGNRTPNPRQRRNVNPPPPSTSAYYYYQAASGLPIFLHPLDIKILLAHFSSYSAFPDAIAVRVDAFSEGTVNDDLRKRCKYLAHMPDGADVVFVEADLTSVVGGLEGGLKNFEGALKMRAARRKEKGRKDERARVRAEERERENRDVFAASAQATATWRFAGAGESPVLDEVILPAQPAPEGPSGGAWGARSFAAALHSAPTTSQGRSGQPAARRQEAEEQDEWDMDSAWHELEAKSGGGKKRNKLVVLGSGGGGRRRR